MKIQNDDDMKELWTPRASMIAILRLRTWSERRNSGLIPGIRIPIDTTCMGGEQGETFVNIVCLLA